MDTEKILEIIRITFPVFALLALGNVLSRTKKMNEEHQTFLNWLVYHISLPALIFVGMATQPFSSLLNFDFIIVTIVAMLIILAITATVTSFMKIEKTLAVVVIFNTYWSNVAYMGFPMSQSAFGDRGFLLAAIVNAVSMPILVAITFVMIGLYKNKSDGKDGKGSIMKSLYDAFCNPIILASIAGIVYAYAADATGLAGDGAARLPIVVREGLGISEIILNSVGTMGLSLALLAIGGKLRFHSFGKNLPQMAVAIVGKLVILPLLTLILMRTFFPNADDVVVGSAVLLMAMPSAVVGAIIAAKFKLNEEFAVSTMAMSILCSVIAIPIWLYVVL